MNKPTVSVISAILATLVTLGGVNITDVDAYYCADRGIIMNCDRLSSTTKTCYNPDIGGKRCLVEPYWQKIENDITLKEPIKSIGKQYHCDNQECIEF